MNGENATPIYNIFTTDIFVCAALCICEEEILRSCSAVMLSAGEICDCP